MNSELEELIGNIQDAMFDDMENGVAWLNDLAWKDFNKKYPALAEAISKLFEYRNENSIRF